MYWFVFSVIVFLIISLTLNIIFLFYFVWQGEDSKLRQFAQNLSLLLFSFLIVCILLELFFKLFFAQPDTRYTLAHQNWLDRYWQNNSLGYRDIEWTPELLAGRTKIMVLGDSFAAGAGIQNKEDRFSDLLGQLLGDDYAVMNVGRPGADTKEEFINALAYPYPSDIVILSFFVNDIEDTARDMGFKPPRSQRSYYPLLAQKSYAFNFFYWRIYRLGLLNSGDQGHYWNWLLNTYSNPDIWQIYQAELLQAHHLVKERNGQLIVVVFPTINAIQESRPITSQVVNLYREQGVPVLDVTELVADLDPDDLVVNSVDSHPNELVHRLVAERLYQLVLNKHQ